MSARLRAVDLAGQRALLMAAYLVERRAELKDCCWAAWMDFWRAAHSAEM
jgi:hypothetical protein